MTDLKTNLKSFENRAEEVRKRTAQSLESAAESVRAAGDEIHGFADQAGKKLDSTAAFVRKTCVREKMLRAVRDSVRRYPVRSLALAATVGLVAGFCCRSSD